VRLGLFRGLHCPFCRRQVVQLGAAQPALKAAGVETLAIINTPVERARLYFVHRPTPVTLLADPDCRTHAAYGVLRIGFIEPGDGPPQWPTRTTMEEFQSVRISPGEELSGPTQPMLANDVLNQKDGFELTAVDREIFATHGTQLVGHFLIDRDGVVRWTHSEARDSAADLCRFPSVAELVAATRILSGR